MIPSLHKTQSLRPVTFSTAPVPKAIAPQKELDTDTKAVPALADPLEAWFLHDICSEGAKSEFSRVPQLIKLTRGLYYSLGALNVQNVPLTELSVLMGSLIHDAKTTRPDDELLLTRLVPGSGSTAVKDGKHGPLAGLSYHLKVRFLEFLDLYALLMFSGTTKEHYSCALKVRTNPESKIQSSYFAYLLDHHIKRKNQLSSDYFRLCFPHQGGSVKGIIYENDSVKAIAQAIANLEKHVFRGQCTLSMGDPLKEFIEVERSLRVAKEGVVDHYLGSLVAQSELATRCTMPHQPGFGAVEMDTARRIRSCMADTGELIQQVLVPVRDVIKSFVGDALKLLPMELRSFDADNVKHVRLAEEFCRKFFDELKSEMNKNPAFAKDKPKISLYSTIIQGRFSDRIRSIDPESARDSGDSGDMGMSTWTDRSSVERSIQEDCDRYVRASRYDRPWSTLDSMVQSHKWTAGRLADREALLVELLRAVDEASNRDSKGAGNKYGSACSLLWPQTRAMGSDGAVSLSRPRVVDGRLIAPLPARSRIVPGQKIRPPMTYALEPERTTATTSTPSSSSSSSTTVTTHPRAIRSSESSSSSGSSSSTSSVTTRGVKKRKY